MSVSGRGPELISHEGLTGLLLCIFMDPCLDDLAAVSTICLDYIYSESKYIQEVDKQPLHCSDVKHGMFRTPRGRSLGVP